MVDKGVITVDPHFVALPKESQDLGPLKQAAMPSHRLLSTDKAVKLLLRFYNDDKYGTLMLKMLIFAYSPKNYETFLFQSNCT